MVVDHVYSPRYFMQSSALQARVDLLEKVVALKSGAEFTYLNDVRKNINSFMKIVGGG